METKPASKVHYAWVVLGCCLLMSISNTIISGTVGNFTKPVVTELDCPVSSFTMIISIQAFAMAVLYPVAGRLLQKLPLGRVVGLALLGEFAGIALMGTYTNVWGFYLSGALTGIGSAFSMYVAIPIIINMWFKKRNGFALGVAMSCGSIGGIVFNLLSAALIGSIGWRSAFFVLGAFGIIVVPLIFIFLKSPAEKGIQPFGAGEEEAAAVTPLDFWGLTRKKAFRSPAFYLAWATCLCFSIGTAAPGYIASFATMELNQTLEMGAFAAMCYSVGVVVCGMILGTINDKYGVKAGTLYGVVFFCAGMGCFLLSISNNALLLPACILTGLGGSMYTVQAPLVARHSVGGKYYSDVWAVMMVGNSMIGALTYAPMGLFYDLTGTYMGMFITAGVVFVLGLILGTAAVNLGRKIRANS